MTTVVADRHYTRGAVVPFEEDITHEFKGHRTICLENRMPVYLPHHVPDSMGLISTRKQWSKYLCGMLNTGLGGVLYAGIFDNGEVNGFMMSPYQRFHVALQLQEVLGRFKPPVPDGLVTLQFVRMLEPMDTEVVEEPEDKVVVPSLWRLEHSMNGYYRCWCDQEANAAAMRGLLLPWYVIEVVVGAQRAVQYKAEDGLRYMRGHGQTEMVGGVEMAEMAD